MRRRRRRREEELEVGVVVIMKVNRHEGKTSLFLYIN